MSLDVYLTPEELRRATDVGVERWEHSKGMNARFDNASSRNAHIVGAQGELGFCKGLGFRWMAHIDTFKAVPDVEPFWEVRATHSLHNMPVKTVWAQGNGGDHPWEQVAFVLANPPEFRIIGFITAGWAQSNLPAVDKPKPDGTPRGRPAHWVNEYQLTPIDEGFHSVCAWINGYADRQGWLCLYCGKPYEEGQLGRPSGDGALEPGRVG